MIRLHGTRSLAKVLSPVATPGSPPFGKPPLLSPSLIELDSSNDIDKVNVGHFPKVCIEHVAERVSPHLLEDVAEKPRNRRPFLLFRCR
jgi:hypothetical protein